VCVCLIFDPKTLAAVVKYCHDFNLLWEGALLKPNMVLSGYDCKQQAPDAEVAEKTVRCFTRTVPAAVPGIVFLSGGQNHLVATAHLSAINQLEMWQADSFDPETIAGKATFEDPFHYSVGMRHVFVNGVQVLKDGEHTGAKPGRVVHGPGYRGERMKIPETPDPPARTLTQ